ncbi:MAG: hypothetical protein LIO77_05625 [Rikenellaceae bacterium]|nr:hypothetical protein [Rikenellaceae bacterium]
MKIKHLFLAAAALAFGLTSCSKDEGGVKRTGPSDVYIQVSQLGTRADTDPVSDNTAVEFSEGYLFFTDSEADPNILRYVRITNNTIAGTVSVDQLKAGKVIESVHQNATTVWVFGNVPAKDSNGNDLEIDQSSKMSDIESKLIDILSQTDDDFGVKNATLYGSGAIDFTPGTHTTGEQYDGKASFQVAPIIARLEIDKIQANNEAATLAGSGVITSFKLEGIYINNYYFEVGVNSGTTGSTIVNYLQDIPSYLPTTQGGQYDTAWEEYLYDLIGQDAVSAGGGSFISVEPSKTWAYNVFANHADPHIVFHLTGVEIDNSLRPNPQTAAQPGEAWLTVTSYVHRNTDNPVNIEGGKVCKMANVYFTADDLGNTPEPNDKLDILVEIELLPWKVVPVDPKFD